MPRYAHPDFLDGGLTHLRANCDRVILTDSYTSVFATANTTAKVAETALVIGDFAIAGVDGAARVLTATLTAKSAGNALKTLADGTNMHLVFVNVATSKVLYVTEESSNQPVTLGNPITLNSNPTYTSAQPVA